MTKVEVSFMLEGKEGLRPESRNQNDGKELGLGLSGIRIHQAEGTAYAEALGQEGAWAPALTGSGQRERFWN